MPTRPCPHCHQSTPRFLPFCSELSVSNFYRCDACGYVFSVEKSHPNGSIREVAKNEPSIDREGGGRALTIT
jgi:hypothetical protein